MGAPGDPVALDPISTALDGAIGDYSVSGDAMRWSPETAAGGETPFEAARRSARRRSAADLTGLDVAAGLGAVLGLDPAGVRRLVSSALFSLTSAAGDVVGELRQLTRGSSEQEVPDPEASEASDQEDGGAR